MTIPAHTIKLQDGKPFNLKRRFRKHYTSLISAFGKVKDGRDDQGKRHPLGLILTIIFAAITTGSTTLDDCHLWAIHNRKFLKKYFDLTHGLPVPTTLSRTLQVIETESLIEALIAWRQEIYGISRDSSASFDGKTMCAVHGKDVVKHIVSLLTHDTYQTLGQIGVNAKENEIPASYRLLEQVKSTEGIFGMTLVADALHCQKKTAKEIIRKGADYLLFVKGNQKELKEILKVSFDDPLLKKDAYSYWDIGHGRHIKVTVEISDHLDLEDLRIDWEEISFIGKVRRVGTRTEKGVTRHINETVYFISSKNDLTAKKAANLVRKHWRVENNLHWQKDWTFLEDRTTLRIGNAPQAMTFLRSFAIGIFHKLKLKSISETVSNLQKNPGLHHQFLLAAAIV